MPIYNVYLELETPSVNFIAEYLESKYLVFELEILRPNAISFDFKSEILDSKEVEKELEKYIASLNYKISEINMKQIIGRRSYFET